MTSPYSRELLDHVFRCKTCGAPLLMVGCANPDCGNNNTKRLNEYFTHNEIETIKKETNHDN